MPTPICPSCQTLPRFQRRPSRHGLVERLVCPRCERATRWLLAAINAEHRPELLFLWDRLGTDGPRKPSEDLQATPPCCGCCSRQTNPGL